MSTTFRSARTHSRARRAACRAALATAALSLITTAALAQHVKGNEAVTQTAQGRQVQTPPLPKSVGKPCGVAAKCHAAAWRMVETQTGLVECTEAYARPGTCRESTYGVDKLPRLWVVKTRRTTGSSASTPTSTASARRCLPAHLPTCPWTQFNSEGLIMFTWLGLKLTDVLDTYVFGVVSTLMTYLRPLALAATTIWILLFGWAVLRGEAPDTVPSFAWRMFKIVMVLSVALQANFYMTTIADTANGLASGVATTFLPTGTWGHLHLALQPAGQVQRRRQQADRRHHDGRRHHTSWTCCLPPSCSPSARSCSSA